MARDRTQALPPPFLREIRETGGGDPQRYPYTTPLFARRPFRLAFTQPVTLLVGENGTGKSTLLEAIAADCGFHPEGGDRNQAFATREGKRPGTVVNPLLVFSWRPRVGRGFFLRAESFFNLARALDGMAGEPEGGGEEVFAPYGGRSLRAVSHGESFMALFRNRFKGRGIYLLDEADSALSPMQQLRFLELLDAWRRTGEVQVIIATHAPILMAYPHAQLLEIGEGGVAETTFDALDHVRITRRFLNNREGMLRELFATADEGEDWDWDGDEVGETPPGDGLAEPQAEAFRHGAAAPPRRGLARNR
ncbi:MAG: AAA family ATPase [Rhodospirillaceae bacterium]|nr:AAA family ATPase [Rhodospirillaceae bacterium]